MNRARILTLIGFCLAASSLAFSQKSVESIYRGLLEFYRHPGPAPSTPSVKGPKCGLIAMGQILDHWSSFSEYQKHELRIALEIPQTQKTRTIGHFRFYYDTTGLQAPSLLDDALRPLPNTVEQYVDSAGAIFNHVWDIEVGGLGFSPPPLDSGGAYPVVIQDLYAGLYGRTVLDSVPLETGPPARYRTHIEIDNDYQGPENYYSFGLSALRVTAAHEFNHAIQFGAYAYWGESDLYFHEITSTWMEDVVYTDVNDYYQYLTNDITYHPPSQFSQPEIRFTEYDGSIEYSRAVWGKFVEKKFSQQTMRTIWETMRSYSSIPAMDRVFNALGTTFRQMFLEYAYWNSTTGPRCDTARFYSEGLNYPAVRTEMRSFAPPSESYSYATMQPLSSHYASICRASGTVPDSACMRTIVSNINMDDAYTRNQYSYNYILSTTSSNNSKHLANGLYATLTVADPQNWSAQESIPSVTGDITVFPDPFRAGSNGVLWFELPSVPAEQAGALTVYSSSLELMFSGSVPVVNFSPLEPALRWNGQTTAGKSLATGVYFYSVTIDNQTRTGKFAVIRQ